jgi:WD40 repeat protein
MIAASKNNTIKVWDIKRGRELHALAGHTNTITAVAISPDGRVAISASGDKTVKVWDVEEGLELHTLKGHAGALWGVGISMDGGRVISASEDNTVKVWSMESGLELATFTCETTAVCCSFCTPNVVVVGDASGRVYFLQLVLEDKQFKTKQAASQS